jgi:iron(III) transport system substrate-binding protein
MLKQTLTGLGATCLVALSITSPVLAQKVPLTVYTSMENEQLKIFKDEIEKTVPDADIQWLRDTTGVITARVLAEKAAPKADMIFGLAASSLLVFNKEGLLENYKPVGEDKLKDAFRSKDGSYVGMDAFLGVVCYNTIEGEKAGLKSPAAYKDILDPKFKGKIVMPHPASSGTGYLMVAAWLQTMGDADGWKFMDALHENIAVYTHSGSAPCVQAAKGERVVGLGYDMRAASEKSKGAPIDIILPTEGAGWDMEASSIVKGTKNLAVAKKVLDWAATKGANELYSKYYAIVAHPDVKNLPKNYPENADTKMAKIDLQVMANNRDAILAEWSKRYESKAAPKQ